MFHPSQRITRALAVMAVALGSISVGAPSAVAAAPSYYPSGPQINVPIATVTGGGWTPCWAGTYDSSVAFSQILNDCDGRYIMYAAGPADADTYTVLAAGERTAVFTPTVANYATTLNNSTYWYFNTRSMGFSPVAQIYQNSADVMDAFPAYVGNPTYWTESGDTGPYRLSWHTGASGIESGWRAGTVEGNSQDVYSYNRVIYESDVAPKQPQLVVDALNVRVDMGQSVPADVRVLGLVGTDSVTNVVLEYSGVDIWGKAYGPSTTPPSLAGEYDVSVKSYTLNAVDPKVYWQTKHPAKLWIRWVPLPISDGALKAPATNADAPGAVVYGDNGATVTGTGWSLTFSGAPRASVGGFLITDPGTVFTVTGMGYRPWSPVRMFFMSDPVELGSVYTDAAGAFTAKVTLPSSSGNHMLQVNGYSPAGVVRSSNVALYVGTTRSLSDKFLFDKNSSELTSAMSSRIALMMNSIPVKPWRIHVTLTTSALALSGPNAKLTQARVDRIASQISASLKAAGVDVVVESTIWYQPGLAPRWEKKARWVFVDLNW